MCKKTLTKVFSELQKNVIYITLQNHFNSIAIPSKAVSKLFLL